MTRAKLIHHIFEKQTCLCVGLDPELGKLPAHLPKTADGVLLFCKEIIDATRRHCVAYKPNLAFFEALGPDGLKILAEIRQHIGPTHLTIADGKRGDIGNTGRLYAEAFFQKMGFDALTVAPYMGEDSVRPFLGFEGKWAIVLGLTSNPGSRDFQMERMADGRFLFEKTISTVASWGGAEELMFVVGATQAAHIQRVREIVPEHFLLVPGIGAQGGDLEATLRAGLNADCGLLINSSRNIIFASGDPDFAEAAGRAAQKLSDDIGRLFSEILGTSQP